MILAYFKIFWKGVRDITDVGDIMAYSYMRQFPPRFPLVSRPTECLTNGKGTTTKYILPNQRALIGPQPLVAQRERNYGQRHFAQPIRPNLAATPGCPSYARACARAY